MGLFRGRCLPSDPLEHGLKPGPIRHGTAIINACSEMSSFATSIISRGNSSGIFNLLLFSSLRWSKRLGKIIGAAPFRTRPDFQEALWEPPRGSLDGYRNFDSNIFLPACFPFRQFSLLRFWLRPILLPPIRMRW